MTISVQLYSVRDFIEADAMATLARLAAIGFDAVEPYAFAERLDVYTTALPASGLAAPSGHAHLLGADLARVFDAAEQLGIRTVVEPAVHDGWNTVDGIRRIAAELSAAAAVAADRGLRVGYHNHAWEALPVEGRPAIEHLADAVDPRVVLEVDTYWSTIAGVDTPALLQRLGDRVQLLHVKDGPLDRDAEQQVPLGHGDVPVEAVLAAAPRALRVLEFDHYRGDVFAGLAEGLRFVRGVEGTA